MKIEILSRYTPQGKPYVEWSLYDGPDGIEHVHGYACDLIQAFSKILEWNTRIGEEYAEEILKDLDTLKTFLDNTDETN